MNVVAQLDELARNLTPDNWAKGSYFSYDAARGQMCNCLHGAAQRVVNPRVAQYLRDYHDVYDPAFLKDASGIPRGTTLRTWSPAG